MKTFVIQIPTRPEETAEAGLHELGGVGPGSRRPLADTRELLAFLRTDRPRLPKGEER